MPTDAKADDVAPVLKEPLPQRHIGRPAPILDKLHDLVSSWMERDT